MAFMLRSHNGVHCCGTVGDSHPSSQLIAAKRTFTGDSFQNHDAKVRISEQNTKFYLRIFVEMPGHGVADAFYGGIIGITYSVSRHPLLS
jgi:hypothetical protein